MLRFILVVSVLFVAPYAIYALMQALTPVPADGAETAQKPAPHLWLAGVGAGLALVAAIVLGASTLTGSSREGHYIPPRLEDGRIVPGRIEPVDESAPAPVQDPAG